MFDWYGSGVLNPDKHKRLVSTVKSVVTDARIPEHMIASSALDYCGEGELSWLKNYRHLDPRHLGGLCLVGSGGDIGVKMFAITAALLRNYIRARVFTLQEVIESYKVGKPVSATVLCIPNFYLGSASGGKIPDWQLNIVTGMLYSRMAAGDKTIIYVDGLQEMSDFYGETVGTHIKSNFKVIKG